MNDWLLVVGFLLLGYLAGSLPTSVIVTRVVIGKDVRDGGSGHATTTNTIRQAGWLSGLVVFILDVTKGVLPTYLAMRYAPFQWAVPLVAGLTVVGHCWPVFAGFRGGMGLSVAGGSLLSVGGLMALLGFGLLAIMVIVLRQSARAAFFTGILIAPFMFLIGAESVLVYSSFAAGIIIAIRFFPEWNRQYKEKWLDGNWR